MKRITFIFWTLLPILAKAQTEKDLKQFLKIFKQEIETLRINNIDEHFNEGYFRITSENDFFPANSTVSLTNIFQQTVGKSENRTKQVIKDYFEQAKKLRAQNLAIEKKMDGL